MTIVSVNGGLLFYKEYEGASRNELFLIYGGIALMLSAMVTVTYFKSSLPPIAPCDGTGGATDPAVQPEQAAQEVEALTTHRQSEPHPARQEGYQHSRETDNAQHLPRKTETGYVL